MPRKMNLEADFQRLAFAARELFRFLGAVPVALAPKLTPPPQPNESWIEMNVSDKMLFQVFEKPRMRVSWTITMENA